MYIEHLNIRVPSIAATEAFLKVAFPHFQQRGSGHTEKYGYWSHFGDDHHYVALSQLPEPGTEQVNPMPDFKAEDQHRLMHVGVVVHEIEALAERLRQGGYEPYYTELLHSHPFRQRVYALDGNGIEWEFLQYHSDDPAERNRYDGE